MLKVYTLLFFLVAELFADNITIFKCAAYVVNDESIESRKTIAKGGILRPIIIINEYRAILYIKRPIDPEFIELPLLTYDKSIENEEGKVDLYSREASATTKLLVMKEGNSIKKYSDGSSRFSLIIREENKSTSYTYACLEKDTFNK